MSEPKYRAWTSVFHENSHFTGTWVTGNELLFSDGKDGMISEVTVCDYPTTIELVTRGLLQNNMPDYTSSLALPWIGTTERYEFTIIDAQTTQFHVMMSVNPDFAAEFETTWPAALLRLKSVCETNIASYQTITLVADITAPLTTVWQALLNPDDIQNWNFADPSWYCPAAINTPDVGGRFCYTMAARDQSMSFDFTGTFTTIQPESVLEYLLDDGRFVSIQLTQQTDSIHLVQKFDAETVNSLELQRQGWQAILDNFTAYVETK